MTHEQIRNLLNKVSTAAAKYAILYNGAIEQNGSLNYGLDDVLGPILFEALSDPVIDTRTADEKLDSQLRHIYVTQGLIEAIKVYRSLTGSFLKESKAYVENLCKDLKTDV